jgi:hypothetical protein
MNAPPRSLFAVWRWPRWALGLTGMLMASLYVLSAVPTELILYKIEDAAGINPIFDPYYEAIYFPVLASASKFETFNEFLNWQEEAIRQNFFDP